MFKIDVEFLGDAEDEICPMGVDDFVFFIGDDQFAINYRNNMYSPVINVDNNKFNISISVDKIICLSDNIEGAEVCGAVSLANASDAVLAIKTLSAPYKKIYKPTYIRISDGSGIIELNVEDAEIWTSSSFDENETYDFVNLVDSAISRLN